jgi:type IV secretory pathway VirB4 component
MPLLGINRVVREGLAHIEPEDLYKHMVVIGGTGKGKTTFLHNILSGIKSGCIILDPYGDLAEKACTPGALYVTKENPLSLNPFKQNLNDSELANLIVEAINIATKVVNPEQIESTVLMAELIRMAIKRNVKDIGSLADVLTHPGKFPVKLTGEQYQSCGRIRARLSLMVDDENIKPFLFGKGFNVAEVAKRGQRVIFDLSGLDDFATSFLGGLIATTIKSYYQHEAKQVNKPLFFVVDEFRLFFSRLFHRFLAECRKYQIGVILAGHSFHQAGKDLTDMILANCYTRVFLGGHSDDLKAMGHYKVSLKKHEAVAFISDKPHYIMCFPSPDTNVRQEVNFWRDGEWVCTDS